ncbi:MAG: peptidylprolyl isomerase [bacterium]
MRKFCALMFVLAFALPMGAFAAEEAVADQTATTPTAQAAVASETTATSPTANKPQEGDFTLLPRVKMETTKGDIILQLDAEKAPISTLNFLQYAREGFYNDTIFHRVMSNFMIQGGGYTVAMDEKTTGIRGPIRNEWENGLKNKRGTIVMARLGGQADSATAQFFINVVDNIPLDAPRDGAGYAVFGNVIDGMNVVDAIRSAPVARHPKYPSPQPVTPVEPIVIKSVSLLDKFDFKTMENKVREMEIKIRESQGQIARAEMEARAEREKMIEQFIAQKEKELGKKIAKTPSGLRWAVLKEGTGAVSPKPADTVQVHYRGTLLNGKEFDSSYKRGTPISFPLKGVIAGWTEGVGMMKVGEKRLLIIPPELGYGSRDIGDIPPNSVLVFEVELLGIK